MAKKSLSALFAVCAALFISSCSEQASKMPRLRFVTGGEAGTYYAFGSVIAQHASNHANVQVVGLAGKGSQGNIMDLQDKVAELAFCQSDVMTYAFNGTNLFQKTGAVNCFSVLGKLYLEQVQIVTVNPEIKTVSDLKGKVVSIGASGSGVYFNALDILGIYGLTEKDITPTYQSFGDSADAIRDGKIDAAFIVAGAPTNAITDLSTTRKVHLVSLDKEHIDQLVAKSPFYSADKIAKELYKLEADTLTVSVSAVIIVRNDVPAEVVHRLCADIYDNAPTLVGSHAKYAEVSLEAGASIKSVPYHPGAVEYFVSKGVMKSDDK